MFVWGLVFLLIVYLLSPGPIAAIYRGNVPNWIRSVYAPVSYVADRVPAISRFYSWYVNRWFKYPPAKV